MFEGTCIVEQSQTQTFTFACHQSTSIEKTRVPMLSHKLIFNDAPYIRLDMYLETYDG